MTSLGEYFPVNAKRDFVEGSLKPGCVLRLEVRFPQVTKPKFLVLVANDDPDYLTFIINSEISNFIQNRPAMMQCQVAIDAESHPFLTHNSHIACHETLALKREDVIKELIADPSAIKGEVSDKIRAQIISAVKFTKGISNAVKQRILSALDS